jgi:hypothetical protein
MEEAEEKTAQRCDNCQTLGLTARLDSGKGMATRLCAVCWARLMTWRQQQNARQKGPPFVIRPWPLAEGGVPSPQGPDARPVGTVNDRTG